MSKDIQLSETSAAEWQTDWEKCCLCQEEKKEAMKCPFSKSHTEQDGYKI